MNSVSLRYVGVFQGCCYYSVGKKYDVWGLVQSGNLSLVEKSGQTFQTRVSASRLPAPRAVSVFDTCASKSCSYCWVKEITRNLHKINEIVFIYKRNFLAQKQKHKKITKIKNRKNNKNKK